MQRGSCVCVEATGAVSKESPATYNTSSSESSSESSLELVSRSVSDLSSSSSSSSPSSSSSSRTWRCRWFHSAGTWKPGGCGPGQELMAHVGLTVPGEDVMLPAHLLDGLMYVDLTIGVHEKDHPLVLHGKDHPLALAQPRPKRSPHPHRQRRGCLASKSSREGGTTAWTTPFTLAYFTNPAKAKMDFCPLPAGGCGISPNL